MNILYNYLPIRFGHLTIFMAKCPLINIKKNEVANVNRTTSAHPCIVCITKKSLHLSPRIRFPAGVDRSLENFPASLRTDFWETERILKNSS